MFVFFRLQFFDLKYTPDGKGYTQCRRLHFCIQPAIAMIAETDDIKRQWASKRVKLLLELIPEKLESEKFPVLGSLNHIQGTLILYNTIL